MTNLPNLTKIGAMPGTKRSKQNNPRTGTLNHRKWTSNIHPMTELQK